MSTAIDAWKLELAKCQDEISKLDPNPYYLSAYKKEELSYWCHIPKWMFEDSKTHKVKKCLDIGCAYGTLALYSKKVFNCETYCIDFTDNHISKSLINTYSFHFENNNIELDPFPWNTKFDVIIFTDSRYLGVWNHSKNIFRILYSVGIKLAFN